jgi:hypothetical protein
MIKLSELRDELPRSRPEESYSHWSGFDRAQVRRNNAFPVLIEIAEAALAYEQARKDAALVRFAFFQSGDDSHLSAIDRHDKDECRPHLEYEAALAKVTR